MHKRLKNYLNKPFTLFLSYPVGQFYYSLMIVITAQVINLLQPFGLNNWNETHKWLVISGYVTIYAGVYWFIYMFCSHLFPDYYSPHRWTRLKELRVLIVYVPLVTIAGWVFTEYAIEELVWTYKTFLRLQYYNCLLGAFILLFLNYVVFPKIKSKQHSFVQSSNDNIQVPVPEIIAENYIIVKNKRVDVNELIYVESNINNVHVWFLHKGRMIEIIERCPMKRFKIRINAYSQFLHCHESYLVNVNDIKSWSTFGNKMEIHLKSCAISIPVSRNRQASMKEVLNSHYILKK